MSARLIRSLSTSALFVAVTACNVDVVDCDNEDASVCRDDLFDGGSPVDDEDSGSASDAGGEGPDASAPEDGGSQADSAVDGGAAPVELSVEEFCAARFAAALAWRDAIEAQCPNASTEAELRAGFLATNLLFVDGRSIDGCVTSTNDLIDKGQVAYVGSAAQACADAYNAQFTLPPAEFPAQGIDLGTAEGAIGHGAASPAQIPACREALVGKLKLGDSCPTAVACGDGLRCLTAPGGAKTCQKAVVAGGQCNSAADCDDTSRCLASTSSPTGKLCVSKDALYESQGCEFSTECATGLVCNASSRCISATPNFICPS